MLSAQKSCFHACLARNSSPPYARLFTRVAKLQLENLALRHHPDSRAAHLVFIGSSLIDYSPNKYKLLTSRRHIEFDTHTHLHKRHWV